LQAEAGTEAVGAVAARPRVEVKERVRMGVWVVVAVGALHCVLELELLKG